MSDFPPKIFKKNYPESGGNKALTDDDDLWSEFLKNVTPLDAKKKIEKDIFQEVSIYITPKKLFVELKSSKGLLEIEKPILKKLRKNSIRIDSVIDLHGFFLEKAYDEVYNFVSTSFFLGKKCLLVITGKGGYSGERATIRSSIKGWIENSDMVNMVHSISDAADIHGGSGALYLMLKKYKR